MKTASLLQALDLRVAELAAAIAPYSLQRTTQARFDQQLFTTRGTQFKDYLLQIQNHMAQLHLCAKEGKTQQLTFLTEKLIAQIAALQRELATVSLRDNEPKSRVPENLYEKLSRHQDYERRLQAMIVEREKQLVTQNTLALAQEIQKEIAALDGRLQRCRLALKQIDRAIEHQERGLG